MFGCIDVEFDQLLVSLARQFVSTGGLLLPLSKAFTLSIFPSQTAIITAGAVGVSGPLPQLYDGYSERITGLFTPPVTANYTFYVSGNDAVALLLSPDATPQNAVTIASSAVPNRWDFKYWATATQRSAPLTLLAGRQYYFQAQHAEGTGSDFLAVAVRVSRGPLPFPRDVRYAATREHQVLTLSTTFVPATQVITLTGAGNGTFLVEFRGLSLFTGAIPFNVLPTALHTALGKKAPINGCPSDGFTVTRTAVRVCLRV